MINSLNTGYYQPSFSTKKHRYNNAEQEYQTNEHLARANSDLSYAYLLKKNRNDQRGNGGNIDLKDGMFHCEQATEKALKAVAAHYLIQTRNDHSLTNAIHKLESGKVDVPENVKGTTYLSHYAYITRYPTRDLSKISEEDQEKDRIKPSEFNKAVRDASAVVKWADNIINPKPETSEKP